MPRLGAKYNLNVEVISRAWGEYESETYRDSDLPPAPAVMVGDELAGQGPGISQEGLEAIIRRHLGLPPLEP